jgi:arginine-tRNA-protein transferase
MPGILTRQELDDQIDLDNWLLLVRGIIVHMNDIVSWDDSDITDPRSLKGIAAELAAVLGPEVVAGSVVSLF